MQIKRKFHLKITVSESVNHGSFFDLQFVFFWRNETFEFCSLVDDGMSSILMRDMFANWPCRSVSSSVCILIK